MKGFWSLWVPEPRVLKMRQDKRYGVEGRLPLWVSDSTPISLD